MRTSLFSVSCLLFVVSSCGQVQWSTATNWKLYRIEGHGLFKMQIDSLRNLGSAALSQDSVGFYLTGAEKLHPKEDLVWMGGYVATCNVGGKLKKVEISDYGGWFFEDATRTYYQIPAENSAKWNAYLQREYLSFMKKQN